METSYENSCSLCIFCLKSKSTENSTDDCDSDNTPSKSNQYRFFTSIIRHFLSYGTLISADSQEWCRNACKVISEITINGDDNEPFFDNVNICDSCGGITRKFSDLYHQMKELELRIDWEVVKLWDVMGFADKLASRREKDELEKKSTTGGVVTLGEFRTTLMQSCQAYQEIKKKVAAPKVQLIQVTTEDFPLHVVKKDVDLPINSEVEEMEHDEENNMHAEFTVHQPMVSSLPPLVFEEDPLNPPKKSQSTYICTTSNCSLPFTSKFELFQHNMAHHIGKYFSSVQLNELPDDRFNYYITNSLETALDTFDKADEEYKCPFCASLFHGREKARNHLVAKHRPVIKEILVEIQKSGSEAPQAPEELGSGSVTTDDTTTKTTLKRKRGLRKAKSRTKPKNLHCSHCSRSFPNKVWLFQHYMSNHPEKYFVSVKLESVTPHQFQTCVVHMLSTTVDELEKVDSKYQCNLCTKLLSDRQCAKNHLVRKHRSDLKGKLVEIQNSNIMNTSEGIQVVMPLNGKKRDHICKVCEKVFEQGFNLYHHQRYSHPEIFFESSNLLSSSSENNELFKKYVRYVLETQSKCLFSKEGDHDQVKCGICSKVLSSQNITKSHLILKHRKFVAEELEGIQKSGKSIQEIEKELLKIKTRKILKKKPSAEAGSKFDTGGAVTASSSTMTYDCFHCSVCFKNKNCLFQHDMSHHIEQYFSSVKIKSVSNDQFKMTIIHLLNNIVDEFQKSNSKYQCSFCPKLLSGRPTSKNHLVRMHRPILKEKLVELQNGGDVPSSHSNTPAIPLRRMGSKHSPPLCHGKTTAYNCSLCSKTFKNKFGIFQHDMSCHIEKYFLSVKLKAISNEQFKKCIVDTLCNCVDNFEKINSKYKCPFCSIQLCGSKTARHHLVAKHRAIIKDKLVEVQKSDGVLQNAKSSISAEDISLKRKGGSPKIKGLVLEIRRGGRPRVKGVIDHVPVVRRRRNVNVSRCERCGKWFANVCTLRTHLKGYCKVIRDLDEESAKIEDEEGERMENLKINQLKNRKDE